MFFDGPFENLPEFIADLLSSTTKEMIEPEEEISEIETEYLIPQEHIGKHAQTVRPLGPSGRIDVDGKKFEAISDMGFIENDTLVNITDIRYHQYVVVPVGDET